MNTVCIYRNGITQKCEIIAAEHNDRENTKIQNNDVDNMKVERKDEQVEPSQRLEDKSDTFENSSEQPKKTSKECDNCTIQQVSKLHL